MGSKGGVTLFTLFLVAGKNNNHFNVTSISLRKGFVLLGLFRNIDDFCQKPDTSIGQGKGHRKFENTAKDISQLCFMNDGFRKLLLKFLNDLDFP